jgi:hypothetical protein
MGRLLPVLVTMHGKASARRGENTVRGYLVSRYHIVPGRVVRHALTCRPAFSCSLTTPVVSTSLARTAHLDRALSYSRQEAGITRRTISQRLSG